MSQNILVIVVIVVLAILGKIFGPRITAAIRARRAGGVTTETPTWWQAQWTAIKTWATGKWWKDGVVLPVAVTVVMFDITLWLLYPNWVWAKVTEHLNEVFWLHVMFCVVMSYKKLRPVWKDRMGNVAVTLFFVVLFTRVLGWTPWLGEKYWTVDKPAQDERVRQEYFATHPPAPPAPTLPYDVVAPADMYSEWVPTMHGEMIEPHGKILLRYEDEYGKIHVVERDDVAEKPIPSRIIMMRRAQFRSRTEEAVKVTIS